MIKAIQLIHLGPSSLPQRDPREARTTMPATSSDRLRWFPRLVFGDDDFHVVTALRAIPI